MDDASDCIMGRSVANSQRSVREFDIGWSMVTLSVVTLACVDVVVLWLVTVTFWSRL